MSDTSIFINSVQGLKNSGLSYWPESLSELYQTTWIEISKSSVNQNIQNYRSVIGPNAILAPVIKANAYGHGIVPMALLCDENPEIDYICVVRLTEALSLRAHGIKKPILVLSIIDENPRYALEYDIDLVVYDDKTVQQLNTIAKQYQKKINLHIKIDTGLSRLGVLWHEAASIIKKWKALEWLELRGIFTHFSESESDNQEFTQLQQERFDRIIKNVEQDAIYFSFIHASCSAAITAAANYHYNFVRLGIGFYGLWPSLENKKITHQKYPTFELRPTLTWKTKIVQIKTLPAHSWIGYDRTFYTDKEITIAILPVGYSDGYDRALSNKGFALINGCYAPVLGRIAMNLMMIDITGIGHVEINTPVTLLGSEERISADFIAQQCNTINYEIVARINAAIARIIVD